MGAKIYLDTKVIASMNIRIKLESMSENLLIKSKFLLYPRFIIPSAVQKSGLNEKVDEDIRSIKFIAILLGAPGEASAEGLIFLKARTIRMARQTPIVNKRCFNNIGLKIRAKMREIIIPKEAAMRSISAILKMERG
jgi:hypothetical protein